MTGGIPAIEGFDTQASIILELMLEAFQKHPGARFRPEGLDDLDMRWSEPPDGGAPRLRHYQFKKVSHRASGEAVEWTTAMVARELLGDAVQKLVGNDAEQVWILGDAVAPEVRELISAGRNAPSAARPSYLGVLHRLAKADTEVSKDSRSQRRLDRWSPPAVTHASIDDDVRALIDDFTRLAVDVGPAKLSAYEARVWQLHAELPDVLGRIHLQESYGHEKQIVERVIVALESRYRLSRAIVENTLFRNLRGYISDIAKEPGRYITREDFEYELICVWPRAVATRRPPKPDAMYLRRPQLVEQLLTNPMVRCVIGPSGAGKTLLAGETGEFLEQTRPDDVVLYAEVRGDTTTRDVLAGMAFMLRSQGIPNLLQHAVAMEPGDEDAIREVARMFRQLPRKVELLVDLVEGEGSLEFRRGLAVFARELKGGSSQLIVFSQKDAFRELSQLEQQAAEIVHLDLPGLHRGEFQKLVELRRPGVAPAVVYEIHQRVTAGRATGMLPALADALAAQASIEAMRALATRPSEELLSEAHRARFDELPAHLRDAARRVVCFSLPMTVTEAIELFQEEPMRGAIDALNRAGLLRRGDDGQVEMHETVRAGLQRLLPPAVVRDTHARLAEHYERLGIPTAQLHHLEEAGQSDKARQLARKRFLAGGDRDVLVSYVAEHRLVSDEEVIALLLAEETPEEYLLPRLLQQVRGSVSGVSLWVAVRKDPARFDRDVQWAWRVAEAILRCAPRLLRDLVAFGLEQPKQKPRGRERLGRVLFAAQRAEISPEESFLTWFEGLPPGTKREVLPFLLLQPEVRRLTTAFQVVVSEGVPVVAGHSFRPEQVSLRLRTEAEMDAFLAALPLAEIPEMMFHRSPLLGPFGVFIWQARELLGRRCRALLAEGKASEVVLQNAMRVLVHLADRSVLGLCRPLRTDSGAVAAVAWCVPVLMRAKEAALEFEAIAVSPTSPITTRLMAMFGASSLGVDIGALHKKMVAATPADERELGSFFLEMSGMQPYPEVIPLFSEVLDGTDAKLQNILQPWLIRIAELPGPGVIELLLKALAKPEFAVYAALLLQRKRTRRALPASIELAKQAMDDGSSTNVVMTALASGPDSLEPFREIWEKHPSVVHWRWVLAGRLRDVNEAPALVAAARDPRQPWQLRRMAILAAGRLPYEAALQSIAPAVLAEPLLLPDTDVSFRSHMLLAHLLRERQTHVERYFLLGKEAFVRTLGSMMSHSTLLPSSVALGWLWERLETHGLRKSVDAIDSVQNELHLPLLQGDVARGLRLQRRWTELDELVRHPTSDWMCIRAFRERLAGGWAAHLEELIAQAPKDCQFAMNNCMSRMQVRPGKADAPPVQEVTPETPTLRRMGFAEAQAFLKEEGRVDDTPIVLSVNREEFKALAAEADPSKDYQWKLKPRQQPPRISVRPDAFVIVGTYAEQVSNHAQQRAALRPAIAAANRDGIPLAWHREHLRDSRYTKRFLASLGAQGDRDLFLQALERDHDLIVPHIDQYEVRRTIEHLVDAHALRILKLYIYAGTEAFFEHLCALICQVKTAEVDTALAQVFDRLMSLSKDAPKSIEDGIPRARSLSVITQHPRFWQVPQAVERLLELTLVSSQPRWRRKEVLQLLTHQPAAYSYFESQVPHAEDFEHHLQDDVDFYDETADQLFRRVDEGGPPESSAFGAPSSK